MSAIYSLPMKMIGPGLCEACLGLADAVTQFTDKVRNRMASFCIDCAIKKINSAIDAGQFPELELGNGKKLTVSHAAKGSKPNECILYERILVKS